MADDEDTIRSKLQAEIAQIRAKHRTPIRSSVAKFDEKDQRYRSNFRRCLFPVAQQEFYSTSTTIATNPFPAGGFASYPGHHDAQDADSTEQHEHTNPFPAGGFASYPGHHDAQDADSTEQHEQQGRRIGSEAESEAPLQGAAPKDINAEKSSTLPSPRASS